MNISISPASRLLAGVGTLALAGGLGLASARPARTAGGPIAVAVANTPLAVSSPDSETRQPFQTEVSFFQGNGIGYPTSSSFTVPAGKALVIQEVSCFAYAAGSARTLLQIKTVSGGTQTAHYAGFLSPGIGANNFTLPLSPTRLHADPASAVSVTVVRDNPPPSNTGYYEDVTVSGYLVDAP